MSIWALRNDGKFTRHINFCDVNKSACMATGGRKIPGAGFSKKSVDFLKFHEPVAPLWLLQLSENVPMGLTE